MKLRDPRLMRQPGQPAQLPKVVPSPAPIPMIAQPQPNTPAAGKHFLSPARTLSLFRVPRASSDFFAPKHYDEIILIDFVILAFPNSCAACWRQ